MKYYGRNQLNEINLDDDDHFRNDYPVGFSKVDIPEGKSGKWKIERFEFTRQEGGLYNLRLIRDGQRKRVIPPGWYTRLVRDRCVVMSDTPAEAHEHSRAFALAKGNVLINGLGLGFYLKAILAKDEVKSVTVIEKSKDVIKLVGKTNKDPRVTIINADALIWRPARGVKFDLAWHDIWDDINEDNKQAMLKLKIAYKGKAQRQACWSEEYL